MTRSQVDPNADLNNVVADIIKVAKQQPGVTAVASGGSLSTGLSTTVRLGEVETVEFNRDRALEIVVYKGQCKGSVAISDFSAHAIDAAIKAACRIAEYTEPDPYAGLIDPQYLAKKIQDLDLYHPSAIPAERAIEYASVCEKAALDFDPRVTNSEGASFSTAEHYYVYGNSDGFLAGYPTTRFNAYCVTIAQLKDSMQRDYDYTVARDVSKLDAMKQLGERTAQKTIARLGARKIKTCKAPVLFNPKMAASLWGALIGAISGSNLYRKSSFLLDQLGNSIFPDFINISEQPLLPQALGSAPFDDEGAATIAKPIISEGKLATYLLGSYSARHLNMQPTGNAGGVHNFTVMPGEFNYDQLISNMQRGLIVTELLGHGINLVTGDYSNGAVGFWVEDGVIQYPVDEITVAGNLREMFSKLVAVGNDVDRRSNIITGSMLIDSMMIAGS